MVKTSFFYKNAIYGNSTKSHPNIYVHTMHKL